MDSLLYDAIHSRSTTCRARTCQARIVFATTEAGIHQPVDVEPTPGGNLIIALDGGQLRSRVDQGLLEPDTTPPDRWMPHHATCPEADQFRRALL